MMEYEILHILWLFATFTLTTQELLKLRMEPNVTAECGQRVTLHCNSSIHHNLSVKYMEWSQDKAILCSVDSKGNVAQNHSSSTRDFHCEYVNGRLSLSFDRVLPLEVEQWKPYRCKQHSAQGASQGRTKVLLQECSGSIESMLRREGPACTFTHVYPDGHVYWFSDSRNLSDGSVHAYTEKSVDEEGWMTVRSYLDDEHFEGNYNCSLVSAISGRLLLSALVGEVSVSKETKRSGAIESSSFRLRPQWSAWMVLTVLLQFVVMS